MNTYQYYVDDPTELYEVETIWDDENLKYVAQDCTEDDYNNHDGWEGPMEYILTVIDKSGKHRQFEVFIEFEPIFGADEVE